MPVLAVKRPHTCMYTTHQIPTWTRSAAHLHQQHNQTQAGLTTHLHQQRNLSGSNTLWQQNTEFLVNMIIFWQVNTKIWQADMNIWQVNIIILTSGLVADICHHISQIAFEIDSSLQSTFKFIDQWSETWNMLFNEN